MTPTRPEKEQVLNQPDNTSVYLPRSESNARRSFFVNGARTAFFAFLDRADAGSSDAQAAIALMYLNGWVANGPDIDNAEYWAEVSSKSGNPYGLWVHAWIDLERSRFQPGVDRLYQSAEQHFAPAIYALGLFWFNGVLGRKDTELGLRLLRQAASMGHRGAKQFVNGYYRSGHAGIFRRVYGLATYLPTQIAVRYSFLLGRVADENGLMYSRSIALQNRIKRENHGEFVDGKVEELLHRRLPSTKR